MKLVLVIFLLLNLFVGCTQKKLVIVTDDSDALALMMLWYKDNHETLLQVKYSADITQYLSENKEKPDIVIAKEINTSFMAQKVGSLNAVIHDLYYNPLEILLQSSQYKNKYYAVPLSYDVPIIVMHKDTAEQLDIASDFIDLDFLMNYALQYMQISSQGSLQKLGFAPSFNNDFLRYFLLQETGAFSSDAERNLQFNKDIFINAMHHLEMWQGESTLAQINKYNSKYLYNPWYISLQRKDIAFAFTSIHEFGQVPHVYANEFRIRFLTNAQGEVYPLSLTNLYVMPRLSNKKLIHEFALWVMNPYVQQRYIVENVSKIGSNDTFSFFSGISSIPAVNNLVLSQYYTHISFDMFNEEVNTRMAAPKIVPNNWLELTQERIIPFVQEIISTGSENITDKHFIDFEREIYGVL